MNEVSGGFEVQTEVVVLVVLPRDVEGEGYVFLGVPDVDVFAGSEEGADAAFWMGGGIRLRVEMF